MRISVDAWTIEGATFGPTFAMLARAPVKSHDVRIGISGWRYAGWRGKFYPQGLKQADELRYAAERFSSIELNGSFYSLQSPRSYKVWAAATPADFVFAVKGSRFITHMKKLRDIETPLANFFASGVLTLGTKLGPVLWQTPPTLQLDAERLTRFFELLPRTIGEARKLSRGHDQRVKMPDSTSSASASTRLRHAMEVRHPSFASPAFTRLAREHDVAIVVADAAGKFPAIDERTSDFKYVRLHGDQQLYVSGYSDVALEAWAQRIRTWKRRDDVFVYFDNDAKVHAPFDALALRKRVDAESLR